MEELTAIQRISIWILPVLFAITLHEAAHGLMAKLLGDDTAARMGRLSINPLHHIDPIGTLLVPGILLMIGGFIFGWAKPVPVDWRRLKNPHRDMALVAVAGPLANFLMAIGWALITRLANGINIDYISVPLGLMGVAGMVINVVLMVLNLLPIPPLDGGRIAVGVLPRKVGEVVSQIEPYGFFILLILIATNLLSTILGGPIQLMEKVLFAFAGI
jgi:Zn-dependent protease